MKKSIISIVTLGAVTAAAGVAAATVEVGPADVATLEATINAMTPGDEVVLQGGTYNLPVGMFRITVTGTAWRPRAMWCGDAAGTESRLLPMPIFSDGFESGNLSAW